jgi:voltage-gated potassium channel
VGVTVYGVVGYRVVAGWSLLDALYMTVITLATVGFREVQPLDAKGQAFTISLILAGVMALFVALGSVTELVVSGQLARALRRRRMDARIGRLDQHTVICAYGRVGRAVAEELTRQDLPLVVIEPQEALIPTLEEHAIPYLAADPTAEGVLGRAGIGRARALVCAVDSDAANVYITLTARALNPKLVIVARASDPASVDTLGRAGADRVVVPLSAVGAADGVLGPASRGGRLPGPDEHRARPAPGADPGPAWLHVGWHHGRGRLGRLPGRYHPGHPAGHRGIDRLSRPRGRPGRR